MVISQNNDSYCKCTDLWHGDDCGEPLCVNSVDGFGPERMTLPMVNNSCLSGCESGFGGLHCDFCNASATLDNPIITYDGSACVNSLAPMNVTRKTLWCDVTQEWLLIALAFGRPVKAHVTMDCSNPAGFFNGSIQDGTCSVSLWRTEPDNEWMDAFFFCEAKNCSVQNTTVQNDAVYEVVPEAGRTIRTIVWWVLVVLCALIVVGGLVPASWINQPRLLVTLGIAIAVVLAFFIPFSTLFGHALLAPAGQTDAVVYDCVEAKCHCGPLPPNPLWLDTCPGSWLANKFPNFTGPFRHVCDWSGNCVLHAFSGLPVPLLCQGNSFGGAPLPPSDTTTTAATVTTTTTVTATPTATGNMTPTTTTTTSASPTPTTTEAPSTYSTMPTIRVVLVAEVLGWILAVLTMYFGVFLSQGVYITYKQRREFRLLGESVVAAQIGGGNGSGSSPVLLPRYEDDLPWYETVRRKISHLTNHAGGSSSYSTPTSPVTVGVAVNINARTLTTGGGVHPAASASSLTATNETSCANSLPPPSMLVLTGIRYTVPCIVHGATAASDAPSKVNEATPLTANASAAIRGGRSGFGVSVVHRVILDDVSVSMQAGRVVALVGASGSGKTTLLDIIAGHAKSGELRGSIAFDGVTLQQDGVETQSASALYRAVNQVCFSFTAIDDTAVASPLSLYRQMQGFVAQDDGHLTPGLTVRQTIFHAARCRLPAPLTNAGINTVVDEVLKVLGLEKCQHTLVGGGVMGGARGVSGGERRRVSIAVALVGLPSVLILDEPTSGLDSVSALRVMRVVASLAKVSFNFGRTIPQLAAYGAYRPVVVFSIHQPSGEVYSLFDDLLVMAAGKLVYAGAAAAAVDHFRSTLATFRGASANAFAPTGEGEDLNDRMSADDDDPATAAFTRADSGAIAQATDTEQATTRLRPRPTTSATALHRGATAAGRPPPHAARPATNPAELLMHLVDECQAEELVTASTAVRRAQREKAEDTSGAEGCGRHPPQPLAASADAFRLRASHRRRFLPHPILQFVFLCARSWQSLLGRYYLLVAHAFATFALSAVLSYLYHAQALDISGAQNKAGMMTFVLLVLGFTAISSLDSMGAERTLFITERDLGLYGAAPFLCSKLLFDFVPLRIIPTAVLASTIYYPIGLRDDLGLPFLRFVIILIIFSLCASSLCINVGLLIQSFGAAALICSIAILWIAVFGGLMVQAGSIPAALAIFKYLSPFFYAYEGLFVNEMSGLQCVFHPKNAQGQNDGMNIPVPCDSFVWYLGLNPNHRDQDIVILCCWLVASLFTAVAALKYVVQHRR